MSQSQKAEDWWRTEIIEMSPGSIRFRGYAIEELTGNVGFVEMIWLMLRGELPTSGQAALLEAALVSGVDHGPQAPSIATARMAMTCGVGMNNAVASAVNVLGDVHGGAGEQAVEFYAAVRAKADDGLALDAAIKQTLDVFIAAGNKFVPGFGHRCPSSKSLGRLSLFLNGGPGSPWIYVKPLVVDGSSGGSEWFVS